MILYQLFALDRSGRVDRGFTHRCNNDAEAVHYAGSILDANIAEIEVMREKTMIAHVRHHDGNVTIVPAL